MKIVRSSRMRKMVFWCGWLFLGAVLGSVLESSDGLPQGQALVLGITLAGIAQVSAWTAAFSCRTAPLSRTPVWRVVLIHTTAAVVLTVFWVITGSVIAREMDAVGGWSGTYNEYMQKRGLLYGAGEFYY